MTTEKESTATMFRSLRYSFKEAGTQVVRNKGMSVASIFSITAMLLILAVVLALTVNINFLTESVKNQFDTVEVFLLDTATTEQVRKVADTLSARDDIDELTYVSKETALEEFKTRWGDSAYLLDELSENPLPNSIRVGLKDLSSGREITDTIKKMYGVEDVRFYADEVNKVLAITNVIQKGAFVIIAFLVIVSVVVVSNTVKLTVLARQDEIAIMKYVGATNWFIRGPLLCEGVIIGFISALVSLGISSAVYYKLESSFGGQALTLFASGLVDPWFMVQNYIWIFIALGISIGAFGSIVSMRRFLKV